VTATLAQPGRAAPQQPGLEGREIFSAEWLLVVVTVFLVYYTYRLFGATRDLVKDAKASSATQAAAMERQRDVMAAQQQAMERQAATAQESSRVMVTQALAMETIATAVTASAKASLEAVDAVKESVAIAGRHLVANYPPVIQVYRVTIDTDSDDWRVSFTLANTGGSRATLVGAQAFDDWAGGDKRLPPHASFVDVPEVVEGTELAPGAALECTHRCTADSTAIVMITRDDRDFDSNNLYFLVRCAFKDDNGVLRSPVFLLQYDRRSQVFAPVPERP
jgi:hypothetical protein